MDMEIPCKMYTYMYMYMYTVCIMLSDLEKLGSRFRLIQYNGVFDLTNE